MSARLRALLVCAALGAASVGGCERAQRWFGEPRAEVESPRRHAAQGLSFAFPGNWRLSEAQAEVGDVALQTLTLESSGEALLLIQVFRPGLALALDEHLELTLRTLRAEVAATGGGGTGVEVGAVVGFERAWLGARRAALRASISVVMPGELVASQVELYEASVPGATALVFTIVPDAGRTRAAAGFELVLDTLALAP